MDHYGHTGAMIYSVVFEAKCFIPEVGKTIEFRPVHKAETCCWQRTKHFDIMLPRSNDFTKVQEKQLDDPKNSLDMKIIKQLLVVNKKTKKSKFRIIVQFDKDS